MWMTVCIPLLKPLFIQLHSLLSNYQVGAQIKKYKKEMVVMIAHWIIIYVSKYSLY